MRNSGRISTKTRLSILVSFVLLCGFTNCSHPIETVCQRDLPQFLAEVKDAEKRAEELVVPEGRAIASSAPDELAPEERLAWKAWAERSLKSASRLMERAENDDFSPEQIQKIHRLSNELVIFWGHVDHGKDRALLRSLQAVARQGLAVQGAFCYQKRND